MKKMYLLTVLALVFTIVSAVNAQSYSVWFTSPGSLVSNVYNSTQVKITPIINASGSNAQYHVKWKFILHTDNESYTIYDSNTFPYVYRGSGSYNWSVDMVEVLQVGEYTRASGSVSFNVKYKISAANNFGSGTIELQGSTVSSGSYVPKFIDESVSVGAIDQNDGSGYYRIWNTNGSNNSIWYKNGSQIQGATSRNYSYMVASGDNGVTLTADLKKVCDLSFQANSSMYVNGSTRTSPWTESVVEQNSIYADANGYSSNGIEYTFSHWDNNPSSNTITASAHGTYTAVYIGKPTNSGEYVSAGGTVGQPVVVTWTDNPNTAVNQFQIWRRVKHNGVTGDPVLLTTVGRGVQSYTDYDYAVTNGYTNDLLWYDVRAYYSTEGTYSDPDYTAVYGIENPNIQSQDGQFITTTTEIPTDYSISNYPNPFNPTTTINYQLPQDGFVTIKVYDLLGKEVAALVNENKSAGYHRVNFDASKLTSGVYVYTITANNFVLSKKMLLMK